MWIMRADKRIWSFITGNAAAYVFFAAIYAAVFIELFALSECVGDSSTWKLRSLLFTADAAVLFLFYWFVAPRWRWLALPVIWLVSLFVLSNVLYYRYWGDMYPLQDMFSAANYNAFVFSSIGPLWQASDCLFILLPAAVTALWFVIRPQRTAPFSVRFKAAAVLTAVLLFAAGMWRAGESVRAWQQSMGIPLTPRLDYQLHRYDPASTQTDMWKNNGLAGYLFSQIKNYPDKQPIELTAGQRQSIADFIAEAAGTCGADSCLADNSEKNLVFIIVESLNAWTVGKRYGDRELTPVLDSLLRAEGTISSLRMFAQINDGGSSDGQLIYNTGLLPLLRGVAVMNHVDNRFPSLAEALNRAVSAEFIVESASVYNHRRSSQAFGYDTIYDASSLRESARNPEVCGDDEAVLSFAFETMSEMPQPFFAEITTLSMHYPFNIKGFEPVEWIDSVAPDDYFLRQYLQTVHYTDAAIGRFLDRLNNSPFGANTVVVIASDHDEATRQRADNANSEDDSPIVFMALNTGKTLRVADVAMAQADVFPTILDIMGASDYYWRGLGRSILAPDRHRAVVSRTGRVEGTADSGEIDMLRRAFEVSDTLLRSDYFSGR